MSLIPENVDLPVTPYVSSDPAGWEQGLEVGPAGGKLCVKRAAPPSDPSEWDAILAELLPEGFDVSDYYVIDDTVQVRSWDANMGDGRIDRFYYFKADVARRSGFIGGPDVDLESLKKAALKRKPVKKRVKTTEDVALVVHLADWQIGKGEGGGTAATVERIHVGLDAALDRAKQEKPASIVLCGLGDLAEGCAGWYPTQLFEIDLDEREQMRVASRLLLSAVDRFLQWPILMTGCISNHGEKRGSNGKIQTSDLDNRDLEMLDRVVDVMGAAPDRYGDVRVVGPDKSDPAVTRFDVHGVRVATAHGHVGFNGRDAATAAEKWWLGQMKGQRPAADAEVLLTGHRHHLALSEWGIRRTWVQAPAMDGGSIFFASSSGSTSHPGMLTSLVGDGVGRSGISSLVVHPVG